MQSTRKFVTVAIAALVVCVGCNSPQVSSPVAAASPPPPAASTETYHIKWNGLSGAQEEYEARHVVPNKTILIWKSENAHFPNKTFYIHFTSLNPCKVSESVNGNSTYYKSTVTANTSMSAVQCTTDMKVNDLEFPYVIEVAPPPHFLQSTTPCRGCVIEKEP